MAEIMNEIRLPSYYKSFTKNFKFFVSETKPDLSVFKNYAICEYTVDNISKFCSIEKVPHFHILFECSSPSQISLIKTRSYLQFPVCTLHFFICLSTLHCLKLMVIRCKNLFCQSNSIKTQLSTILRNFQLQFRNDYHKSMKLPKKKLFLHKTQTM